MARESSYHRGARRFVAAPMRFSLTLLAATFWALAGCAGNAAFQAGKDAMTLGDYQGAVEHFREALEQDPNNARYGDHLGEAESFAAEDLVYEAKYHLQQGQPQEAQQKLAIALKYMPAHPEALMLMSQAKGTAPGTVAAITPGPVVPPPPPRQASPPPAEAPSPPPAPRAAPADERKAAEKARTARIAELWKEARAAANKQQWERTVELTGEVLALKPDHADASKLQATAKARREAVQLVESALAAHQRNPDDPQVLEQLRRADTLWSDGEPVKAALRQVTQGNRDRLAARLDDAVKRDQFAEAIAILDALPPEQQAATGAAERRKEILDKWRHRRQGEAAWRMGSRQYAGAWREAVEAAAVSDNDRAARSLCESAEKALRKEIAYTLVVLPLPSETVSLAESARVCGLLLGPLDRIKPEHVRLPEKIDLAAIVDHEGFSLSGISRSEELAILAERLGGADLMLFVDLNLKEGRNAAMQSEAVATTSLRLVEVATARLLWHEPNISVTESNPDPAVRRRFSGADAAAGMRDEERLRQDALEHIGGELARRAPTVLAMRAQVDMEAARRASGDTQVDAAVRFLFQLAEPGNAPVDEALNMLFGQVPGQIGQLCRQVALDRLGLGTTRPVSGGSRSSPRVDAPAGPALRAVTPPPRPEVPPAPTGRAVPPPPVEAPTFRGTLSRDDDRFPKRLMTIDQIEVRLRDTDHDPVDADIEVNVGKASTDHDDLRVGARVRGRGMSRRSYYIIILDINPDTETIRFMIEPAD